MILVMINISFCRSMIVLQNEIFIITNIMYHTDEKLQILCKNFKRMERSNFT